MAIALTLKQYLEHCNIDYDVVRHKPTSNSMDTAAVAHVPGDRLIKSVILKDDTGFLMAVLPSTYHVKLGALDRQLRRHLGLVTEDELGELFSDCELGAIPPVGNAYHVDTIIDKRVMDHSDIYFEAGDHTQLIRMNSESFKRLMVDATQGEFTQHI